HVGQRATQRGQRGVRAAEPEIRWEGAGARDRGNCGESRWIELRQLHACARRPDDAAPGGALAVMKRAPEQLAQEIFSPDVPCARTCRRSATTRFSLYDQGLIQVLRYCRRQSTA